MVYTPPRHQDTKPFLVPFWSWWLIRILRLIHDTDDPKCLLAFGALVAPATMPAVLGREAGKTQAKRQVESNAAANHLLLCEDTEGSNNLQSKIERFTGGLGKVAEESRRGVGERVVAE